MKNDELKKLVKDVISEKKQPRMSLEKISEQKINFTPEQAENTGGSQAERGESYLVLGMLNPNIPVSSRKNFGPELMSMINSPYEARLEKWKEKKEKNAKSRKPFDEPKPNRAALVSAESDYAIQAIKLGQKIGKEWGPGLTEENTKVVGQTSGELSPEFQAAAPKTRRTSITDILVGGLKTSVKQAKAFQLTTIEDKTANVYFSQAYKIYSEKYPKDAIKFSGDYADWLEENSFKIISDALSKWRNEKVDTAMVNRLFRMQKKDKLKPGEEDSYDDAQRSFVASLDSVSDFVFDDPEIVNEALKSAQNIMNDTRFKSILIQELIQGKIKFKKDDPAVPTHVLFFDVVSQKFQFESLESYFSNPENIEKIDWRFAGGKDPGRSGTIRTTIPPLVDKLKDAIISECNSHQKDLIIEQNVFKKASDWFTSKILAPVKNFTAKILNTVTNAAKQSLTKLLDLLDIKLLSVEVEFKPPELKNEVVKNVKANEHLTNAKVSYKMLVEMIEEAMSEE